MQLQDGGSICRQNAKDSIRSWKDGSLFPNDPGQRFGLGCRSLPIQLRRVHGHFLPQRLRDPQSLAQALQISFKSAQAGLIGLTVAKQPSDKKPKTALRSRNHWRKCCPTNQRPHFTPGRPRFLAQAPPSSHDHSPWRRAACLLSGASPNKTCLLTTPVAHLPVGAVRDERHPPLSVWACSPCLAGRWAPRPKRNSWTPIARSFQPAAAASQPRRVPTGRQSGRRGGPTGADPRGGRAGGHRARQLRLRPRRTRPRLRSLPRLRSRPRLRSQPPTRPKFNRPSLSGAGPGGGCRCRPLGATKPDKRRRVVERPGNAQNCWAATMTRRSPARTRRRRSQGHQGQLRQPLLLRRRLLPRGRPKVEPAGGAEQPWTLPQPRCMQRLGHQGGRLDPRWGITTNNTTPTDNYNSYVGLNDRDGEFQFNQMWAYISRPIKQEDSCWQVGGHADIVWGT